MDVYKYKAIFFDLDGTLVDSVQDLNFAISEMASELKIKQPEIENVKNWIGNGTLKLVEKSLYFANGAKPNTDELNHAFALFSKAYRNCIGEYSCLYSGVKELLVKLLAANIKLACITNKPLEFTEFLLQQNMISQFFSVVCAGDNVLRRKPDPWPLIHASKLLKVNIGECLMIGDSTHDVNAARNAGCDVLAVTYGYNHGNNIEESHPDGVVSDLLQLI